MKRAVFAVLVVALSSAMAFGAVRDFGAFKLDLPKGWKVTDKYVSEDPKETTIEAKNGKRSTIAECNLYGRDDRQGRNGNDRDPRLVRA